jgi:formylglycine-generating enzyme required for sulfatase activity
MPKVFISYRRDDSGYGTDPVWDYLRRQFGDRNVFLDVGSVPLGVDFRQDIKQQIADHDVVLVMIGPRWAQIMQERVSQSNDYVRIEIEFAFALNKLIIPVLVMGASLPDFTGLPPTIQNLQWRNAAEVRRQPDFENDCAKLAQSIRDYFEQITKSNSLSLLPQPFDWINIARKGFTIAKYPLTNAQYRLFIDAGGYKNQEWWTEIGWTQREKGNWTTPQFWMDKQWNGADHPVVGISWYEAIAFCLWLSHMTGENITLPTSMQWISAAQGEDNRKFPWGNEWHCNSCNNSIVPCQSKRTTPVRWYETKGDSPYGVVDMAGNVWEWCRTADYSDITDDIDSAADRRMMFGGSWMDSALRRFRCDGRYGDFPFVRYPNVGLRLALHSEN